MLCEIARNYKLYVISLKYELMGELIGDCQDEKVGDVGGVGQRVQTSSYELNMS